MKKYLPVLAGLIVSIIFGFSFLSTQTALNYVKSPFHLLAFRFTLAFSLLYILKLTKNIKVNFKGKNIKIIILLSVFQPITYFIFETIGIKLTSSSETGMMIAVIPVIVTILGYLLLNEKPSRTQTLFVLVSVFGVIFINVMKGGEGGSLLGIIMLVGAVISAGFYNILSRKSSTNFKPIEITYLMMAVGAVTFNIISIINHIINGNLTSYFEPIRNIQFVFSITYLGGLSSVIAFFMLNYMLSKLEASKASVFSNLTTIVSIIAGVLIGKENFKWYHLIGAIFILIGVWGTNYFGIKNKKKLDNYIKV